MTSWTCEPHVRIQRFPDTSPRILAGSEERAECSGHNEKIRKLGMGLQMTLEHWCRVNVEDHYNVQNRASFQPHTLSGQNIYTSRLANPGIATRMVTDLDVKVASGFLQACYLCKMPPCNVRQRSRNVVGLIKLCCTMPISR